MKTISIRLSDLEHRKLVQQAEKIGTTVTDIIREAAKKAANNFVDEIKNVILDSEARTSERISDFRNNLVSEFSLQQKRIRMMMEEKDEE